MLYGFLGRYRLITSNPRVISSSHSLLALKIACKSLPSASVQEKRGYRPVHDFYLILTPPWSSNILCVTSCHYSTFRIACRDVSKGGFDEEVPLSFCATFYGWSTIPLKWPCYNQYQPHIYIFVLHFGLSVSSKALYFHIEKAKNVCRKKLCCHSFVLCKSFKLLT